MDQKQILQKAVPEIIAWFRRVRRDLPWRKDATAYHVWVSETMLQQTRIETVIPYYHRFLAEFPTVQALAEADEDRLMKLWEGLGYYSRAKNLQKAAKMLVETNGGNLPKTAEELRKLPGIGDYTAGAIASIAFGQPEPAIDGNVLRVLSRLTACDSDIMLQKNRKAAAESLKKVYPQGEEAALMTEGIMELGETVCIPNGAPKCGQCPLGRLCIAHKENAEEKYPVKTPKKPRKTEEKTVFLLCCRGKYALCRRGEGLLGGMWQFPNAEGKMDSAQAKQYLETLQIRPITLFPCGESKHIFTHIEWHMSGFLAECKKEAGSFIWKTPEEIKNQIAIPSAFRYFLTFPKAKVK